MDGREAARIGRKGEPSGLLGNKEGRGIFAISCLLFKGGERQQLRYLLPGAGDWISKPDLTYLDECLRDFGSNTGFRSASEISRYSS